MNLNENLSVELKKLSNILVDTKIEQFRNEFLILRINGVDDKEGYQQVFQALQIVKKERVKVDKTQKKLKKDALKDAVEYNKVVDAKAKEIFTLLEPIETHLAFERSVIDDQVAEIKRKKEMDEDVSAVWDQAYNEDKQVDFQREEKIRLEKQRITQENKEAELKTKEEKIKRIERENQIRLEEQKIAKLQVEQAEAKAREEAQLKIETEQKLEKANQKRKQEELDKKLAEEKRKLELAPDKEKIEAYLTSVTNIKLPNLINDNLSVMLVNVVEDFTICLKDILKTR